LGPSAKNAFGLGRLAEPSAALTDRCSADASARRPYRRHIAFNNAGVIHVAEGAAEFVVNRRW
jgi:hypothetical protein